MKIWKLSRRKIIKVDIKGGPNNWSQVIIDEANLYEAHEFIIDLFSKVSVTVTMMASGKPQSATVTCIEYAGTQRGRSKSCTVYGLSATEIKEQIESAISKN